MLVFSPPSLRGWAKSGKTEFYLSSTLGGVHRRLVAQLVEAAVWEWLAWAANFGLGSSRYEDERFDFSARSELPVAEPVARSIWRLNCTATWIWFWLAYALPSTWTATHVIQHAINGWFFPHYWVIRFSQTASDSSVSGCLAPLCQILFTAETFRSRGMHAVAFITPFLSKGSLQRWSDAEHLHCDTFTTNPRDLPSWASPLKLLAGDVDSKDSWTSWGIRSVGFSVAGGPWSSVSILPEPAAGKRDGQWVVKVARSLPFIYLALELIGEKRWKT